MTSKREQIVRVLERAGVLGAALAVRSRIRLPWLTVLTYHRIADPNHAGELDADVIDATPADFDAQLALLAEHFRFVGLDDVLAWIGGRPLPPNPVLITFDDGYRECLTTALPLLKRYGARATFFVPTWYVSERRLFWWDRIALILRRSPQRRIELRYPRPLTIEDLPSALRLVKTHKGLDVDRFVDELAARAGVELSRDSERALVDQSLLTWQEVRELSAAGMDIGSHTRTHRVLGTLENGELEREIAGSRAELEAEIGCPAVSMAYPVGYAIDDNVRRALVRAGYRVGFTNQTAVAWTAGRVDPFALDRLAMYAGRSALDFRALMAFPPLLPQRRA